MMTGTAYGLHEENELSTLLSELTLWLLIHELQPYNFHTTSTDQIMLY